MDKDLHHMFKKIDQGIDCSDMISKIEKLNMTPHQKKSYTSLKLRHAIIYNKPDIIVEILSNNTLMKRDYWSIVKYYYNMNDTLNAFDIMFNYINIIDTYDIDMMLDNKWYNLITFWDGYPVVSNYESNTLDTTKLLKYTFETSHLITLYRNKIPKNSILSFENKIKNCDILIDGANIAHVKKTFDYNELIKIINLLETMNLKPIIILHEHHNITNSLLKKYIVRTPKNIYDDNYLLYGMFLYNKMVVSNDLFRDHVIELNVFDKCYINMMTIQYNNNKLQIPQYSKCIQVINKTLYIPCINGIYNINI